MELGPAPGYPRSFNLLSSFLSYLLTFTFNKTRPLLFSLNIAVPRRRRCERVPAGLRRSTPMGDARVEWMKERVVLGARRRAAPAHTLPAAARSYAGYP